jgi:hypothetical protein
MRSRDFLSDADLVFDGVRWLRKERRRIDSELRARLPGFSRRRIL